MPSVFANMRSIVHKGDGGTNVAAPPDVCKTPSPGGPVPIPYVNIARNGDLSSGSKKTKIEGNSIALKSSKLSTSSGDEPGTAGGGIVSSKFKGKMKWAAASSDVKVEGKGVVRFAEVTLQNSNNPNTAFMAPGGPGPSYAADFTGECEVCGKTPADHPKVETTDDRPSAKYVMQVVERLRHDYTLDWTATRKGIEAERSTMRKQARRFNKKKNEHHDKATALPVGDPERARHEDLKNRYGRAERRLLARRKEMATDLQEAIDREQQDGVTLADTKGYMVGAMMCLDHPNMVFVACSGKTLPGFKRVVNEIGQDDNDGKTWVLVDKSGKGANGYKVTQEDYVAKNSLLQDPDKKKIFEEKWEFTEKATNKAPEPGVCAAAKLLTHEAHTAVALTEAYFGATENEKVTLQHIRDAENFCETTAKALDIDWDAVAEREYEQAQYVPSCRTCQDLLPFALCEDKDHCS